MANTAGQWHALIDCYGQHRRLVARSNFLLWPTPQAVERVTIRNPGRKPEVDIKKYAKVEKIPGGEMSECRVLNGVMINKDVTHHKMPRKHKNPSVC